MKKTILSLIVMLSLGVGRLLADYTAPETVNVGERFYITATLDTYTPDSNPVWMELILYVKCPGDSHFRYFDTLRGGLNDGGIIEGTSRAGFTRAGTYEFATHRYIYSLDGPYTSIDPTYLLVDSFSVTVQ